MARGNPDKLRPVRSKHEASERGKIGGQKSGEARRAKKALRERLEPLLETRRGDMDMADALALALIDKALEGDVRAFVAIRDTIGEKPTDKLELAGQAPPPPKIVVRFVDAENGRPREMPLEDWQERKRGSDAAG